MVIKIRGSKIQLDDRSHRQAVSIVSKDVKGGCQSLDSTAGQFGLCFFQSCF